MARRGRGTVINADNTIFCKRCEETKDVEEFYFRPEYGTYRSICKKCFSGSTWSLTDKMKETDKLFDLGYQVCGTCKEQKPLSEFNRDRYRRRGYSERCRPCEKIRMAPIKRNNMLKHDYGITTAIYEDMLVKQEYKCFICTIPLNTLNSKHIHIDHCHATGRVRKILCKGCNHGLGNFRDDITLLQNAISYLKQHQDDSGIEYCI